MSRAEAFRHRRPLNNLLVLAKAGTYLGPQRDGGGADSRLRGSDGGGMGHFQEPNYGYPFTLREIEGPALSRVEGRTDCPGPRSLKGLLRESPSYFPLSLWERAGVGVCS